LKEILLFAGTTEGRELSECLAAAEIAHTICVATEYGEIVLKENAFATVHRGRMDAVQMRGFIEQGDYAAVVDATHPYATLVTQTIKEALEGTDIPYFRLKRDEDEKSGYSGVRYFENSVTCAKALEAVEGNILLTTGSKELNVFCAVNGLKDRLYVRVLPGLEGLKLCMEQGIVGKQILALQGPFTEQMNEAILRQYQICCLVTKESGTAGGYREKIEAAEKVGIPVYVIGRTEEQGASFDAICTVLEDLTGREIKKSSGFEIVLAGIGMGKKSGLTKDVQKAIEDADVLIGAERMISAYEAKIDKKAYYKAEQIIPYLEKLQRTVEGKRCKKIVILFSGDSGFYSGCQSIYKALQKETEDGRLRATVSVLPGISSVAYLAACIGESYQDAAIFSMHGKRLTNLSGKIKRETKSFILMSGVTDVQRLGSILSDAGLGGCTVIAGYQLSYPEQCIRRLTAKECTELTEDGLYICCVLNPNAESKRLTHGFSDSEFLRDKVPMTKEEVREVSICKLRLKEDSVLYDIGSGTGSIAVEVASLSDNITVYAVEKKEEALALIQQNKEKFYLENIEIVAADAQEGLEELPVPTHAFVGGTGGKLKEILSVLYRKNSAMRVVMNAISMETICEMKEVLEQFSVRNDEVVQIQASRAKMVGKYHLMQAENPVWICAFDFAPEEE